MVHLCTQPLRVLGHPTPLPIPVELPVMGRGSNAVATRHCTHQYPNLLTEQGFLGGLGHTCSDRLCRSPQGLRPCIVFIILCLCAVVSFPKYLSLGKFVSVCGMISLKGPGPARQIVRHPAQPNRGRVSRSRCTVGQEQGAIGRSMRGRPGFTSQLVPMPKSRMLCDVHRQLRLQAVSFKFTFEVALIHIKNKNTKRDFCE